MDNEQIVAKLRQDHAYMVALMERIGTLCTQTQARSDCNACPSEHLGRQGHSPQAGLRLYRRAGQSPRTHLRATGG